MRFAVGPSPLVVLLVVVWPAVSPAREAKYRQTDVRNHDTETILGIGAQDQKRRCIGPTLHAHTRTHTHPRTRAYIRTQAMASALSDDMAELQQQLLAVRTSFDAFVAETRAKAAAANAGHAAAMAEHKGAIPTEPAHAHAPTWLTLFPFTQRTWPRRRRRSSRSSMWKDRSRPVRGEGVCARLPFVTDVFLRLRGGERSAGEDAAGRRAGYVA
jgi:hypothetical protein